MKPSGNPAEDDLATALQVFIRRDVRDGFDDELAVLLALRHVRDRAAGSKGWQQSAALDEELNAVVDELYDGTERQAILTLFGIGRRPRANADVRRTNASRLLGLGAGGAGVTGRTFKDSYEERYVAPIARALLRRGTGDDDHAIEPLDRGADDAAAQNVAAAALISASVDAQQGSQDVPSAIEPLGGLAPAAREPLGDGGDARATRRAVSSARFRTRWLLVPILLVGLGLVARALLGGGVTGEENAARQRCDPMPGRTTVDSRPQRSPSAHRTERPSAHVLLFIDTSASMNCLVDENDPTLTRIEAARAFALPAIDDFTQRGDQLGLSVFRTASRPPYSVADIVELGPANRAQRVRVKTAIARLKPSSGGTPLFEAIINGIQRLEKAEEALPSDAVLSLVILTDAAAHSDTSAAASRRLAGLPDRRRVRVLISARDPALCGSIRQTTTRFDLRCLPARGLRGRIRLRNQILELVRKPRS